MRFRSISIDLYIHCNEHCKRFFWCFVRQFDMMARHEQLSTSKSNSIFLKTISLSDYDIRGKKCFLYVRYSFETTFKRFCLVKTRIFHCWDVLNSCGNALIRYLQLLTWWNIYVNVRSRIHWISPEMCTMKFHDRLHASLYAPFPSSSYTPVSR